MNIFIEFNGIPGSGKTTLSNILVSKKINEYNFLLYSDYLEDFRRKNIFAKVFLIIIRAFKPVNIKFFYYSLCFLFSLKKINKDLLIRLLQLIKLFHSYNEKKIVMTTKIILVDQGIIQQIVSMLHENILTDNNSLNKMVDQMVKQLDNYWIVNLDADNNTTLKRIKERPPTSCRLERMDYIEAKNILEIQKYNLSKIRDIISKKGFNSFTIENNDEIKLCAEELLRRIEKNYGNLYK